MGLRGVDRVVIAVHNLEKSKRQYSELLGATFMDADWTGEPFGINVAISWDAGIELCAPMAGREEDSAVSQFLARRGEGILTVCFGVDDADLPGYEAQPVETSKSCNEDHHPWDEWFRGN